MTQERNWSEHDQHIIENATLEQARKTGHTHAAYGWARTPWGNWTEEQKQAFYEGFDSYKEDR